MRKIRRLHHLQKERQRLQHRELELENSIRSDWSVIRQSFDPATLATKALASCTAWIGQRLFAKRAAKRKILF